MGWFTKKEDINANRQMPELPELPDSPNTNLILPDSREQISSQSYPSNENSFNPNPLNPTNLNQIPPIQPKLRLTKDLSETPQFYQEIRPGMQKSKFSNEGELPDIPQKPIEDFGISPVKEPVYTTRDYSPLILSPPKDIGIVKTQGSFKPSTKSFAKKDDSVYIRLDKFQITMEAFKEIKEKIREIEDLLNRTKEIKAREEKEIEEWEREVETIKLKLDSINKEISGPEE